MTMTNNAMTESQPEPKPALVLREYQKEAIEWLIQSRRRILADDPGLGKSFTAAEAVRQAGALPALVVAPSYIVTQWVRFLDAQYPCEHTNQPELINRADLSRTETSGAEPCDPGSINETSGARCANVCVKTIASHVSDRLGIPVHATCKFAVVSLQRIRKISVVALYRERSSFPFRAIIFDESHRLANRRSQQSKAALELSTSRPNLMIVQLTATPIRNYPDDLYNQLRICEPKNDPLLQSYYRFIHTFMNVIDTPYGSKPVSVKKSAREPFKQYVTQYVLGRTYKDVGRQLPRVIESEILVTLSPKLRKAYTEIKQSYRIGDQPLAVGSQLTTLRTFVSLSDSKTDALMELLSDTDIEKNPVVIFTWYRDTADHLMTLLRTAKRKLDPVLISGDQAPAARFETLQTAYPRPIVATISSVSEGVDLSRYRTVIFYEYDWTPATNYQALSRVVRDRNDDGVDDSIPVRVYYVLTSHSIDVTIHRASKKRGATAEWILRSELDA